MDKKRRNILLVAYACRPGLSSEREVGWKWASLIQKRHNVFVLTRATHRPFIEEWIEKVGEDVARPTAIYYDLPDWIRCIKSGERGLYFYYVMWSLFAILKARRMHREHRFEITHFLTFGTLLWPQFAFLMNTKYVLGPVGGGERIPYSLHRAFETKGRLKVLIRWLVQCSLYLNPVFWLNIWRADRIFARTRETLDFLPAFTRKKTELFLETAMPDRITTMDGVPKRGGQLVIVTVGRLIASKVNRLTLEVIHDFKVAYGENFRFVIVGDGPERANLEAVRDDLGLNEVIFKGGRASSEVLKQLQQSDIYFSTTMKEGGTWAFFEAIACRLPIVCLQVNGPDMIVGDGCGIKVPPRQYGTTRRELCNGLLALARSPERRKNYSDKALAYLQAHFTWERVLDRVDGTYDLICDERVLSAKAVQEQ